MSVNDNYDLIFTRNLVIYSGEMFMHIEFIFYIEESG